uniref:Protein phosphatase 1 regulatory subunit 14 n=1 Tax=Oryctolagus cuniculus TaxID=9986 RepID=A0A5F9CVR0_RABIT
MAAQRLGKRVLSKLQAPSRARGPGGSPGGLQKRHARVTVKYDRRELQRRLDVEKWIDGRLEELYRGREAAMPDEVNIDELLELENEEERSRKIQVGGGQSCPPEEPSVAPHNPARQAFMLQQQAQAQRGFATCPGSHSSKGAELGSMASGSLLQRPLLSWVYRRLCDLLTSWGHSDLILLRSL